MIPDPDDLALSELGQIGEAETRRRFMRGDYADPSISSRVEARLSAKASGERLLLVADKEAKPAALNAREEAEKANRMAIFAAIMAAIANILAVIGCPWRRCR